jgi:predicted transcriptional regulator of viral defense system
MIMNTTRNAQIFNLAQSMGVLRPRDLGALGIPPIYLSRLVAQGLLTRVGRGLYMLPDASVTEHHTLVEAAKRMPQAVVCLLSALRFHEFTTQFPFQVWLAIENKAWPPRVTDLPLRFVRFSGAAFTTGVEAYTIEGVTVKVYTPAKTVADCFKYRHKIGLDVALEGLRDGLHQRKFTVDDLWHYAKICRVANVMKPYLEAMA